MNREDSMKEHKRRCEATGRPGEVDEDESVKDDTLACSVNEDVASLNPSSQHNQGTGASSRNQSRAPDQPRAQSHAQDVSCHRPGYDQALGGPALRSRKQLVAPSQRANEGQCQPDGHSQQPGQSTRPPRPQWDPVIDLARQVIERCDARQQALNQPSASKSQRATGMYLVRQSKKRSDARMRAFNQPAPTLEPQRLTGIDLVLQAKAAWDARMSASDLPAPAQPPRLTGVAGAQQMMAERQARLEASNPPAPAQPPRLTSVAAAQWIKEEREARLGASNPPAPLHEPQHSDVPTRAFGDSVFTEGQIACEDDAGLSRETQETQEEARRVEAEKK